MYDEIEYAFLIKQQIKFTENYALLIYPCYVELIVTENQDDVKKEDRKKAK